MLERVLVRAEDEIDYSTAATECRRIDSGARHAKTVVLDLSHTRFFSSAGIEVLVRAHRTLRASGRRLVVVAPSGTNVRRLLDLAGMDRLLPVWDSTPLESARSRAAAAHRQAASIHERYARWARGRGDIAAERRALERARRARCRAARAEADRPPP